MLFVHVLFTYTPAFHGKWLTVQEMKQGIASVFAGCGVTAVSLLEASLLSIVCPLTVGPWGQMAGGCFSGRLLIGCFPASVDGFLYVPNRV